MHRFYVFIARASEGSRGLECVRGGSGMSMSAKVRAKKIKF